MSEPSPLFGELLLRLGLVTERQLEEALALQRLTDQRVGEVLITLGYVSREQLQSALLEEIGLAGEGPTPTPLGELMVRLKHVTRAQVERALSSQQRSGRRLGETLVELGFCTYKQVYEALALQQRGVGPTPVVDAEPVSSPSGPMAGSGKVRVVVVDDSPIASAMVEGGLTQLGYDVTVFTDPVEALAKIPKLKPSIVLSDLEMPGMNGNDLCRRLKEGKSRAVPVIILTANDADAQRVRGLRAGADDYVSKSASLEEIAARIESVVRRVGETEQMRRLFARYTSDAVVEEILKSPGDVVLTGEKREVSVLFADIRNFTGISESLPPEEVVGMLNEVLGPLSDAVLTCGGTLDKFLGDGLMAVFGAPVSHSDDAQRALQAACSMMEALRVLNEKRVRDAAASGQSPLQLQLGIGINTGPAVAGNFGSAMRTEYTCIGDSVNVAARLCGIAGGGEILVGARTREIIGEGGRFERMEPVRLKGKAQPVPLYRALWGTPGRANKAVTPAASTGRI